jgi:acid phosphatase (class A)
MRIRFLPVLLSAVFSLSAAFGQVGAADPSAPVAAKPAHTGHFLKTADFDIAAVMPAPPTTGSLPALADLETILQVQRERTPDEVAWAHRVEQMNVFDAAAILGPWFNPEHLPYTAKFLHQIYLDCHAVSERAKVLYARPRPPFTDPAVHPCVSVPTSTSYPSGHSTNGFVWAGVLGEIYPEHRAELQAWAHHYAWGRILGGVHFPSDDVGGRLLGLGLLKELAKSPAFQAGLVKARAEAQPFLLKKAS